jgi:N-acetylglutamate synthase-like GNAT family acetyltransferase
MLEIRLAGLQDLDWINKRYDEVEETHSKLNKDHVAVASISGQYVGIGRLTRLTDIAGELSGLYIFPQTNAKGVGEQIVAYLLKENKYKQLYCIALSENKTFYSKHGFRDLSAEEKHFIPREMRERFEMSTCTHVGGSFLLIKSSSAADSE